MRRTKTPFLTMVVPVYNEAAGIRKFHSSLLAAIRKITEDYEIIYCDDGSLDNTNAIVQQLQRKDSRIRLIGLSRNFGKEIAMTAGITAAAGQAIMTIDADGQHPVNRITEFVDKWHQGTKVVVGIRTGNQREGFVKRFGSKLFYKLFNQLTGIRLIPGSTDFRLIDHTVQQEFVRLTERNRITRGLIDWLGYRRDYVYFQANPRIAGTAGYSFKKLLKLAVDSIISLSISPLYITAYIGAFVLPVSLLLGAGMLINALFGDPLHLHATGSAYALILVLFLVGILLVSQGIIGLYLSHIHSETQARPLYVIDNEKSAGM